MIYTYANIPDMWKISALRYAKYAITNMKIGSITRTWWVNLVTKPVAKPQIIPIIVPPIATTRNDARPDNTSV